MIRPGTRADLDELLALQRAVADANGTLARASDELTHDHAAHTVERSLATGFFLVATDNDAVIGAIDCSALGPRQFAHVLGELTIAVHPQHQGQGIGRRLFARLLDDVTTQRPDISRLELMVRGDNLGAQRLYASLGFREEGRLRARVRLPDGTVVDDVVMAWHRPDASTEP
ncbi:MAG: GNAT family N-acetyltransferase [Gemmatimonadota bacterium]